MMSSSQSSLSYQEEVVNTWIDLLKIPSITKGQYFEDDHAFNIQSWWSVSDVTKKEGVTFSKSFTVLKNSVNWSQDSDVIVQPSVIISSKPVTEESSKLSSYSLSGKKKAVVIEKSGDEASQPKRELLQIWSDDTLLKTYDLNELDKHKAVLTSPFWGCKMIWNNDETKLAYLAEKKLPKSKPFFTSYAENAVNAGKTNDTKEPTTKGEEYVFKQTWGEQVNDNHLSVVVVLDISTDSFNVLELSKEDFPMDIQWAGDSIVGHSIIIPIWRLGFVFCSNREQRIFKIDSDGNNFKYLSAAGRGAFSPRVSPDGHYVVWQERKVDGPHQRAKAIMGYDLLKNEGPVVLYGSSPPNGVPIYNDFSASCWSLDSTKLYIATPSEAEMAIVILSLDKEATVIRPKGFNRVLWIGKEHILVACSSVTESPTLQLMEIKSGKFQRALITQPKPFSDKKFVYKYFTGEKSPPSIFIGPDPTSAEIKPKSVPLIVWPHGGPHSVFVNNYLHDFAFFLRSGYAIILLNYIGSIGGKEDSTAELLGHIGQKDVKDCQMITEQVIKSISYIDENQVVVSGGSHGGFLTAQLISTYPDFYKVAVLLNPVIDLNTMLGTTDITDWVAAEAGVTQDASLKTLVPYASSLEDAKTYQFHSPIMNVHKVKAPALILLGTEDLRVPMSQGLAFYRALLAHGKKTEIRVYKDCHSLRKVPVDIDTTITSALWIKDNLAANGNTENESG